MSKAVVCDKCLQVLTGDTKIDAVSKMTITGNFNYSIDLCADCTIKLNLFIDENKDK